MSRMSRSPRDKFVETCLRPRFDQPELRFGQIHLAADLVDSLLFEIEPHEDFPFPLLKAKEDAHGDGDLLLIVDSPFGIRLIGGKCLCPTPQYLTASICNLSHFP